MKKIALVTYQKLPELTGDDRLILDHLQSHGVATQAAIWDSRTVAWEEFDGIILRSCWDYHLRHEEFADWVTKLDDIGAPLWNRPSVVKWNMDKTYLQKLSSRGFPVAPSITLEKHAVARLKSLLDLSGWQRAVVKPVISASAFQTWVAIRENADAQQHHLDEMLARSGVIVQEFVEEVQTRGEWSFIFFNKQFSHAVLKRPKPGDFRVQHEHGGSSETRDPGATFVRDAQKIVDAIAEPLLYARVDMVERNGHLALMELELIEPVLYLSHNALAPRRFAEAVMACVAAGRAPAKPQETGGMETQTSLC